MIRCRPSALVGVVFACLVAANGASAVAQCGLDPFKSLFIIDPSVVDDPVRTTCWSGPFPVPAGCPVYPTIQSPPGVWTFATLIRNMSGSTIPGKFAENWLNTYLTPQTVNGFSVFDAVKANEVQNLINDWRAASGGAKILDLCVAPFRLTAIVYRPDLSSINGGGYGGGRRPTGGEARFVFNILDRNGNETRGNIIFEYNLPAENCERAQLWGRRFAQLSSMPFGPCFNEALQAITDDFTQFNAEPGRPNGSALNQLRINEITFQSDWELREWNIILTNPLDNMSGQLTNVTTKQTPADGHNGSVFPLEDYINADQAAILAGTHSVPEDFLGADFLGGQAKNFPTIWNAPNIDNSMGQRVELRHRFALQTCQGCHFFETGTFGFVHVTGRTPGSPATLSGFLTGITGVPDPVDPTVLRDFNDLQRRMDVLCHLLELDCGALSSGSVAAAAVLEELQSLQGSAVH